MRFSTRTDHDPTPNDFARALAAARARGRLLDLTESNPTRVALPYDEPAILEALTDRAIVTYEPDPLGLPWARQALSEDLFHQQGVAVAPQRVVLTSSTSEGYAYLFKLLCDPGDAVLVPAPSYPLIAHLAALESIEVIPYPIVADGDRFAIDLDALRAARTPTTRAVVVISPNNPTGNVLTSSEHDAIERLGLPLVVDEVFLTYLDPGSRRARSAIASGNVLTFVLSGLSKRALLPQAKLGWILTHGPKAHVANAMARLGLIADTFLSPGAQVQHALGRLLAATAPTVEALRQRLRHNRSVLAGLGVAALRLHDADGGWYAVLQLPDSCTDDVWARRLLAAGVAVQPGWLYDFDDEQHVVVSLLPEPSVFAAGAAKLAETVLLPSTPETGPYR